VEIDETLADSGFLTAGISVEATIVSITSIAS